MTTFALGTRKSALEPHAEGRDGNDPNPIADSELLQHSPAVNPRSRPKSDHAPAGEPRSFSITSLSAYDRPYRANVGSSCQVNFSRDAVQQRLVTSLYKPDLFAELLFEDETIVTERARVKALLDAYKEGFRVLSEVSLKST